MKKILTLFLTMLKIGLFTFGGGYAMIALLEAEFVSKRKWIEAEEFLDLVAIAESTPGPIAINAATYIGYKQAGFWGSFAATLGVCIPSFVIIFVISLFFDAFLSLRLVAAAFRGIQVCVVYLILSAGINMLRKMEKAPFQMVILGVVTACLVVFSLLAIRLSSIVLILICGCVGLGATLLKTVKEGKK